MSTDFRERPALRIPDGAQLTVEVASTAQAIQATGFLHREGSTAEQEWTHDMLWNTSLTRSLSGPNRYIAEVDLDFVGAKTESASVTMSIVDADQEVLREWTEEYTHERPWMGVMQYLISVK